MQKPMGRIDTVAVSSRMQIPGVIPLVRARTLSCTVRMDFDGTIDANPTIEVYYSPDGNNWDNLTYAAQGVAFTINTTRQQTFIIDPPEHGHISIWVLNNSQNGVITNVIGWYSIQSWGATGGDSRGLIDTAEVYD